MFTMIHENYNVRDLDRSLAFYREALGLHEVRRNEKPEFTIVFMADDTETFELELTWLKDRTTPTIWVMKSSTWPSAPMTWRRRTPCMKRWAASATRIPPWGFTSSRTRTDTGWKSFQWANKQNKQSGSRSIA